MKITIIAVGKLKAKSQQEKIEDYISRISHYAKIDVIELKDSDSLQEGKQMLEKIEKNKNPSFIIALSEEGKELSSEEFADKLKSIDINMNKEIIFLIGGPFGLSDEIKKKADLILSLSKMTFPHDMFRIFLTEQIYRAMTIIKGEKYHK